MVAGAGGFGHVAGAVQDGLGSHERILETSQESEGIAVEVDEVAGDLEVSVEGGQTFGLKHGSGALWLESTGLRKRDEKAKKSLFIGWANLEILAEAKLKDVVDCVAIWRLLVVHCHGSRCA